jgi:DNA modification methylase
MTTRPRLPGTGRILRKDCLEGMRRLPGGCVDLVFTSPPYADLRAYARIKPDDYVDWFLPRAREIKRVLRPSGSLILNINDRCVRKCRHLYVHKLVIALVEVVGLRLIETYIWHKPNAMPGRYGRRLKDSFEYVFWLGKTPEVKFYPEAVGRPYGDRRSHRPGRVTHNCGRGINDAGCFRRGWADPGNVVTVPLAAHPSNHPAVMPEALAEFFIKLASQPGDVVLDPFAGSGTTLRSARRLGRVALGFDTGRRARTRHVK